MLDPTLVLTVAKATTLTFGCLLTLLTFRAYRRTGSAALRALMVGIALVTTGVILGGVLHELLGVTLEVSVGVQSVFTAAGFGVLTYSVYADVPADDFDDRVTPTRREP